MTLNSPAYFLQRCMHRALYNMGRVAKEAGMGMDRTGSMMSNDIAYMQETSRHR